MGKKQHSKDRMFITKTEWATEWGGAKPKDNSTPSKRLPFSCCSLTFTPFADPVCTADGSVLGLITVYQEVRETSAASSSNRISFLSHFTRIPVEEKKITSVTVFVNPYTQPDEEEEKEKAEEKRAAADDNDKVGSWFSNPTLEQPSLWQWAVELASISKQGPLGQKLQATMAWDQMTRARRGK